MDNLTSIKYTDSAISLLKQLIAIPSFSQEEELTANCIEKFFANNNIPTRRIGNNIIVKQESDPSKPFVVLNSHHDTVRPSEGWDYDPFLPTLQGDKLTGLGSNDAGASLVSLIMTFVHYYHKPTDFVLMLICSAEEEISGRGGVKKVLQELDIHPDLAIIGEPTECQMATSEKGLMVIDAIAKGTSGHAAHQVGINAIYKATSDIEAIKKLTFDKVSDQLGTVKVTVTQIEAGQQHNVIPDTCHFVIDCRINEHYTNEECLEVLQKICTSSLTPRSTHLSSSGISLTHPIVQAGLKMGKKYYGSPTLSDQVFFLCPSIKIGPGVSSRSHQVNEHIYTHEIKGGINTYVKLLNDLIL